MRSSGWYTGAPLIRRIIGMERALALVDGLPIDTRVPGGWFTGPYLRRRLERLSQRVADQDSGAVVTFEQWGNAGQFVDRLLDLDVRVTALDVGEGSSPYVAQAVHFDGSAYLGFGGIPSGIDGSNTFLFSAWYLVASGGSITFPFGSYGNGNAYSKLSPSGNYVQFQVQDVDFHRDKFQGEAEALLDVWVNVLFAFDRTDVAKCHLLVNGVDVIDTLFFTMTGPISLDGETDFFIFTDGYGGDAVIGDVADWYLAFGQWLDLANPANVAKFIAAGKPVSLGTTGALPTGISPNFFFTGDASTFPVNQGTGGAFTLTGSLTDAETSPSD